MSRRWIPSILAAAALCPSAALTSLAAQGFEGVITSEVMPGGKNQMEMVTMTKGMMSRMDMNAQGEQVYMITDLQTATQTTVMPSQKMYMVMNFKQMAAQMGHQHGGEPGAPPKITKTDKTESIAGVNCTHYLMGDKQDVDVCAATGMGFGLGMMAGGGMMGGGGMGGGPMMSGASVPAGYEELVGIFKDGFFALKVDNLQKGKWQTMMVVTKIEEKTLDASVFTVPEGYQQVKMPGM